MTEQIKVMSEEEARQADIDAGYEVASIVRNKRSGIIHVLQGEQEPWDWEELLFRGLLIEPEIELPVLPTAEERLPQSLRDRLSPEIARKTIIMPRLPQEYLQQVTREAKEKYNKRANIGSKY